MGSLRSTRQLVFLTSVVVAFFGSVYSQNLGSSSSWAKSTEGNRSFIQNKGQFFVDPMNRTEVLFAVDNSTSKIYFTKKGIVYKLVKEIKKSVEEREREEELEKEAKRNIKTAEEFRAFEEKEHRLKVERDIVEMLWTNADPNVEVIGIDPKNDYHSYNVIMPGGTFKNINYIKGYEKIVYKNLYPGIDVEYTFAEKDGLKYSLILHPGADASIFKMVYNKDARTVLNGNLHIDTKVGEIIDHAPFTFYESDHNVTIRSKFKVKNNEVSFELGDYDHLKTVVIDPWTQTPNFVSNWDCVWECEKDGAGNVYIIGGVNKMQLLKYNAGGTLQWTYNTPYDTSAWLGTFATDNAGNSYVTQGSTAQIQKINTAGGLVWNNTSPSSMLSAEFWNITFNCDQTRLVVGGTGGALPPLPYIYQIDVNTGNVVSSLQVTPANLFPTQEVRSICPSGNGKYYFLTHDTVGYINQNFSICGPNTSAIKKASNSYGLSYKCENFRYNNSGIMAIRSSGQFFYTHRGNQIDKRSLTTLAVISSAAIPGGGYAGSAVQNSGIDIDACGNVYVGSKNQIVKYDANLTQLATFATSSAFNVYDVHVSTGGDIIACGSTGTSATAARTGYIQSIAASACAVISFTCCDPSICIPPKKCITDPSFSLTVSTPGGTWSGTGVNASGIFSPALAGVGTHTVVYTLACGSESVLITVSSCSLNICQTNGSLTVSGGTGPYVWSSISTSLNCTACPFSTCTFLCPGTQVSVWTATGSPVSPPTATVFPIKVKDANGTTYTITNMASVPNCTNTCPTLTISVTSQTNVNCFGASTGSAALTTTGGVGPHTYTWVPGNLIGASQTGLAAGVYTINVKDVNGCTGSKTVSISQPTSAISVSVASNASLTCAQNGSASVVASGGTPGYTYTWSPNGGNASSATNLSAGNYTVTIKDANGCTTTTVLTINQNTTAPIVTVSGNATLTCINTAAVLTGTSVTTGSSYTWQPGNIFSNTISVSTPGNYTLNAINPLNGCLGSTVVVVTQNTVVPSVTVAVSGTLTCTNITSTLTGGSNASPASFTWMPGNVTSSTAVVSLPGNYTLTVTNPANGCVNSTVAIVVQNTATPNISASVNSTLTCITTSISIIGNSSTSGVSYSWQPTGQTTSSIAVSTPGNYTLTVIDPSNGCKSNTVVAVVQNTTLPNVSATIGGSITCSNPTVILNGNSTTPSATFTWQPANVNSSTISVAAAGSYTLFVQDPINGCINSTVVTVIQAAGVPTISASSSNSLNCVNTTATLTAQSNGHTTVWNGGSLSNASNPATISAPGSYTAITTNTTSGCTSSIVISVIQNTTAPSITIVNGGTLTCTNTSVLLTGSSNAAPATYTWQPSNIFTNTISVSVAGNYTLTLTDLLNGCANSSVVTVVQNTVAPNVSASVGSTLTCSNTLVTLTGNSSTSGAAFLWQPMNQNTSTVSVSSVGNYSLTVTDPSNGCTSNTVVSVVQNTLLPNISAIVGGTITCTIPTVVINGNSTTSAATFTWLPSNVNTSSVIVVSSGNYTFNVTDPLNGCVNSTVVTVTQNGAFPNINIITPATLTCINSTVALIGSSSTSGVTYLWIPQSVNTPTAVASSAGSYTFSVFDPVNGCTSNSVVSVTQIINTPTAVLVKSSDLNCSATNVTLTAQGSGNNYVWNGGSLVNALNPSVVNAAGNYTVTITDAVSGCVSNSVITVNQSSLTPNISAIKSNDLDCNNTQVTLTGSSTSTNVNFQWVGGPASQIFNVTSPGIYTLSVTDPGSGCVVFTTIAVSSIPMFSTSLSVFGQISCNGGSNGVIEINNMGGGQAPFTITNVNSSAVINNVIAFPVQINGLSAATYTILITDANGCSKTHELTLNDPSKLNLMIGGIADVCAGQHAIVSSTINGGSPGYTYLWTPSGANTSTISVVPLASEQYTLLAIDSRGCAISSTLNITAHPQPLIELDKPSVFGCNPVCNTFSLMQNQIPGYSYTWWFYNTLGSTVSAVYSPTICFNTPGVYNVSVSISSPFNCNATRSYSNYITVFSKPIADFRFTPDKASTTEPEIKFYDQSTGATTYSWYDENDQFSTEKDPTHSFYDPGKFLVSLIVSNQYCSDTISKYISFEDELFYIPNTFTPNDDGLNDLFHPVIIGFKEEGYNFMIFDRWGTLLYKTHDLKDKGWNGYYRGEMSKDDVYIWMIDVKSSMSGKMKHLTGHVTLLK